jgi:hypothetical protein
MNKLTKIDIQYGETIEVDENFNLDEYMNECITKVVKMIDNQYIDGNWIDDHLKNK